MRDLTLSEIIEYAEKIELESFTFYTQAVSIVSDDKIKELLKQLAEDETEHHNSLRNLRNLPSLSSQDIESILPVRPSQLPPIVHQDQITSETSALDILHIALHREINTEKTYAMFMTFTALDDTIIRIFEDLRLKEQGHINKINFKIKNY